MQKHNPKARPFPTPFPSTRFFVQFRPVLGRAGWPSGSGPSGSPGPPGPPGCLICQPIITGPLRLDRFYSLCTECLCRDISLPRSILIAIISTPPLKVVRFGCRCKVDGTCACGFLEQRAWCGWRSQQDDSSCVQLQTMQLQARRHTLSPAEWLLSPSCMRGKDLESCHKNWRVERHPENILCCQAVRRHPVFQDLLLKTTATVGAKKKRSMMVCNMEDASCSVPRFLPESGLYNVSALTLKPGAVLNPHADTPYEVGR